METIKRSWRKAMTFTADLMLYFINTFQPARLRAYIDSQAQAAAKIISNDVIMSYLTQQGLLHCFVCPKRHPLIKKPIEHQGKQIEVYLCLDHSTLFKAPAAEPATARK